MSIYETEFEILASDVDMHRRLRLSRLFTMIQEISIAHTKALGMGRDKTLDRGLLWVVTMQRVDVKRLPVYDEKVKLETWAGRTMHVMFPRYYRMTDTGRARLAAAREDMRELRRVIDYITQQNTEGPRALPDGGNRS